MGLTIFIIYLSGIASGLKTITGVLAAFSFAATVMFFIQKNSKGIGEKIIESGAKLWKPTLIFAISLALLSNLIPPERTLLFIAGANLINIVATDPANELLLETLRTGVKKKIDETITTE